MIKLSIINIKNNFENFEFRSESKESKGFGGKTTSAMLKLLVKTKQEFYRCNYVKHVTTFICNLVQYLRVNNIV